MVDYPRHFAAVFFASGCNFSCGYCHNVALTGRKTVGLSRKEIAVACDEFKRGWVNGVVLTGGEPTLMKDLPDWIRFFKEHCALDVKLDTNGSNPEMLERCLPMLDYVAMDVKIGASSYHEFTGFNALDKIICSINLIRDKAKDYEFRTTVIETIHSDEQMSEVGEMINGAKRYALQAFVPRDKLPEALYRALPRTSSTRLREISELMTGFADEILLRGA